MGTPINVEKNENPSKEEIDTLHKKFIDALEELFNSEKHKYIENPDNVELEFV